MLKKAFLNIILISTFALALPAYSHAEDDVMEILKDFKNGRAEAPIRLTTNKNKLVRLEEDAASVIVNNPDYASVMLDTPRLLIIVPHKSGATSFTVLDKAGKTIVEKDIIVTNTQSKYVRIRRMCGDDKACQPTSYFYCPDGCYEIDGVKADANTKGTSIRAVADDVETITEGMEK